MERCLTSAGWGGACCSRRAWLALPPSPAEPRGSPARLRVRGRAVNRHGQAAPPRRHNLRIVPRLRHRLPGHGVAVGLLMVTTGRRPWASGAPPAPVAWLLVPAFLLIVALLSTW